MCERASTTGGGRRYSQSRPRRPQPRQEGNSSEHLTRRRLQLKQPFRDLQCPRPGIGRRFSRAPLEGDSLLLKDDSLLPVPGSDIVSVIFVYLPSHGKS